MRITNMTLHIQSGLVDDMNLRGLFAIAGGLFFTYAGVLHFTDTSWFEPIVPPILGSATFWVLASGVVEIAVGISLILPKTRKLGGYSSAALLVALYPANLYMWMYDVELGDGASLSPISFSNRARYQTIRPNWRDYAQPLDCRVETWCVAPSR